MLVMPSVKKQYAERLRQHIAAVVEAGRRIGVPEQQLGVHDASKWSDAEFCPYAQHFCGGGAPSEFAVAWLHHIHHNKHHWQHWIFPDGYTPRGSDVVAGVVPMPKHYALEMIADWMGASIVYTGTDDMREWLAQNIPLIKIHPTTAMYVRMELIKLGYEDIVNNTPFSLEQSGV